jgi:hypothetical protein
MPPNDPTNIDATSSINSIEDLTKAMENAATSHEKMRGLAEQLSNRFNMMGVAGKTAFTSISSLDQVAKSTSNGFNQLGQGTSFMIGMLDKLKTSSKESTAAFNVLAAGLLGSSRLFENLAHDKSLASFSQQIQGVISIAGKITEPITRMAKSLGLDLSKMLGKDLTDEIKGKLLNLAESADKSMDFQRTVYNVAAQTGQLNALFANTGDGLQNLSNVSKDYDNQLRQVSKSTRTQLEEVGGYFSALNTLPPIYGTNTDATKSLSNQMTILSSSISAAHGSGQAFNQVLQQAKTILETYNTTADKANEITGEGADLSKTFGVNIGETTGFLTNMASTFQMLGDNTEGVSNIFREFFGGLREGGLGIQPAIQTIQQMGERLANLSIAQKAFISAQSGGAGGLLGGIQIERDLAAGKSAEVMNKLRQTFLAHTGGQVITRDQVHDQGTAAQYERQVQMLKSSAFGGIAKSDEQAAAILKAFSSPSVDKKTADQALKDVVKQGNDYQKLSYTALEHIRDSIDEMQAQGSSVISNVLQGATEINGNAGVVKGLSNYTETAKERIGRLGGSGSDLSSQYGKETVQNLMSSVNEFSPTASSIGSAAKKAFGIGKNKDDSDAQFQRYESEKRNLQQITPGAGGLSHEEIQKRVGILDEKERQINRGGLLGTIGHRNITTGQETTKAHDKATMGHTNAGGTAGHPDHIALTVNVNVDGKKIMQNNQNVALHGQPINQ